MIINLKLDKNRSSSVVHGPFGPVLGRAEPQRAVVLVLFAPIVAEIWAVKAAAQLSGGHHVITRNFAHDKCFLSVHLPPQFYFKAYD